MLFAVCLEGVEIRDRLGPLFRLMPPRDPQRVRDEEVYVLFDEAPNTYRGHRLGFRRDLSGRPMPRLLSRQVWADLPTFPRDVVRVLLVNAFGAGWGDVLIGCALVETLYRAIEAAGKKPQIDFLVHPLGFERERHLEVYKLNPFIHRLHFTTVQLSEYLLYDFYATTESYVQEARFNQVNVYDFFLERLGLEDRSRDLALRLYPNPDVLAEVEAEVRAFREAGPEPVLVLNFFATLLRMVPRFRWADFAREFAGDYRLAFTTDAGGREALLSFLGELPTEVRARCHDLSPISSRSFDHLIAVLHHAADAVITADTSVLHVCGGLNKPAVGLFFSIEPEHRCKYYPTVVGYCHPDFRRSRFWGLSKVVDEENKEKPIQEDPELVGLWQNVDVKEVRAALDEARARPALPASLPFAWPAAPGRRVLVYTGWRKMAGLEQDDFTALLPLILPPDCAVDVAHCRPLEFRPLASYDLVIWGLGDRMDELILSQPALVPFLRAARRRLGIFGVRYPESVPGDVLRQLLSHFDVWLAPTHADLRAWGEAAPRAEWLGEWRCLLSPPGQWELDREAAIDEGLLRERSWEEGRRAVQRLRRVGCETVPPLLAALGAAEEIQVRSRKGHKDQPEGVLVPVLEDVLGRPVAEGEKVPLDRDRYLAYRGTVQDSVARLRQTVANLLGRPQ